MFHLNTPLLWRYHVFEADAIIYLIVKAADSSAQYHEGQAAGSV
jgi:hypothetical protein